MIGELLLEKKVLLTQQAFVNTRCLDKRGHIKQRSGILPEHIFCCVPGGGFACQNLTVYNNAFHFF